ncbi:hypothetical protein CDL12_00426 [Handroanthus impetiginosus]|uniref:Uncharacterized protein n=1 Tax=Handroanthus impetiginosus TaxID=429701 RepID=A0A2G9IAL8_9LAMI|nr:hypothetical protein CDL12_00426 [Handroanthus impetiginosus]
MTHGQDISFGISTVINCEVQLLPLTCRSSFSSFLSGSQPATGPDGFSFQRCADSSTLEFFTPTVTLPSSAFVTSNCVVEQGNDALDLPIIPSRADLIPSGDIVVTAVEDGKSGSSGARALGTHSKRNHRIGLGEQLDLTVSESVIRWASCTNIPIATSFRSSLVC